MIRVVLPEFEIIGKPCPKCKKGSIPVFSLFHNIWWDTCGSCSFKFNLSQPKYANNIFNNGSIKITPNRYSFQELIIETDKYICFWKFNTLALYLKLNDYDSFENYTFDISISLNILGIDGENSQDPKIISADADIANAYFDQIWEMRIFG